MKALWARVPTTLSLTVCIISQNTLVCSALKFESCANLRNTNQWTCVWLQTGRQALRWRRSMGASGAPFVQEIVIQIVERNGVQTHTGAVGQAKQSRYRSVGSTNTAVHK